MMMFGQLYYVLRFNHALAMLGVNPQHINEAIRQSAQTSGREFGATPQEMALVLASQLPLDYTAQLDPRTAMNWIRKRKINPRNPNVKNALFALNWAELAGY